MTRGLCVAGIYLLVLETRMPRSRWRQIVHRNPAFCSPTPPSVSWDLGGGDEPPRPLCYDRNSVLDLISSWRLGFQRVHLGTVTIHFIASLKQGTIFWSISDFHFNCSLRNGTCQRLLKQKTFSIDVHSTNAIGLSTGWMVLGKNRKYTIGTRHIWILNAELLPYYFFLKLLKYP